MMRNRLERVTDVRKILCGHETHGWLCGARCVSWYLMRPRIFFGRCELHQVDPDPDTTRLSSDELLIWEVLES